MSYPYYQPDQQTTIPTPPPPQNWASAPPYGDPQLQSFNQSQPPYYPPDQLIPNQPSFSYPTAPAYSTYESENLPNYGNQNSQKPVYENQNYSKPITEIPGYSKPITEIPGYSKPINEFPNYGIPSLESQNYGKPPLETQIYGKPSYENQNPGLPSYENQNYGKPSYEFASYAKPSSEIPNYGKPSYESPSYGKPNYESPNFGYGASPETYGGYSGNYDQKYQHDGSRKNSYYEGKDSYYEGGGNRGGSYDLDDGFGGGEVYKYDGGRSEPYGARGVGSKGNDYGKPKPVFDDYGNLVTGGDYGNNSSKTSSGGLTKIAKAVPKVESQDSSNGVQKFRVKILPDYGNQNSLDVLCQVGLDGIRMLDPNTNRTLRIYPLENVTKWEVTDPSIYTFWSKSSVDIEPRRIRLQSNRYTTSTILDTVAAACVQIREMADDRNTGFTENNKASDQQGEKKKGSIADWVTLKKPTEEKEHWVPDEAVTKCTSCGTDFGAFVRRHHCRNCGDIFCDKCTQGRTALTGEKDAQPVRVCDRCLAEVTHRLANAKDVSSKGAAPQRSHEDLAKRLMEVLGKNSKGASESGGTSLSSLLSSQSNFDSSGKRTKEVACPSCTVHLQVQVPSSGAETVECGVCQHPFLVEVLGKNSKGASESGSTSLSSLLSSQSNFDSSGKCTKEVACPTCTVHLQVQVPSSGTETVECDVCQHPFLVEVLGKNSKGASKSGSTSLSSLLSSESNFDSSGKRTKEVACPTCTVHLQVQLPSSGTETVECGVCQHPFLVSAR